jgi:hypothetical protein
MSLRLLGVFLFISFGASHPHADAGEVRPPYNFLRYDDDYSFLSDPTQRTDLFDCVKYIPLDGAGYLSFGGEARERFETYKNEEFSPKPNADNAYLLQRYLFHADYHPAEWLRVFGELQSSLEGGRPGGLLSRAAIATLAMRTSRPSTRFSCAAITLAKHGC